MKGCGLHALTLLTSALTSKPHESCQSECVLWHTRLIHIHVNASVDPINTIISTVKITIKSKLTYFLGGNIAVLIKNVLSVHIIVFFTFKIALLLFSHVRCTFSKLLNW